MFCPFENNLKKKDVEKMLKKAGFTNKGHYDKDDWCYDETTDVYISLCFTLKTKYMTYAVGYSIKELNTKFGVKNLIIIERDSDARIAYRLLPKDLLEDIINRVALMYKQAKIELKKVSLQKDFK